jgi:hypothetical protein
MCDRPAKTKLAILRELQSGPGIELRLILIRREGMFEMVALEDGPFDLRKSPYPLCLSILGPDLKGREGADRGLSTI